MSAGVGVKRTIMLLSFILVTLLGGSNSTRLVIRNRQDYPEFTTESLLGEVTPQNTQTLHNVHERRLGLPPLL